MWLSDTLCRLTSGGGFATRRLHRPRRDAVRGRPIILNGTENVVTRDARGERPKCSHEPEVVDHTSCSKTVDRDELVVAVKPGVDLPKLAAGAGDKHERGSLCRRAEADEPQRILPRGEVLDDLAGEIGTEHK